MGAEAAWERGLTVASAREKAPKLCKKSSWREVEGAAACLSSDTASSCTRLSNAQLSSDSSARSPGRSLMMAAASVGMPAQRRDSRACSDSTRERAARWREGRAHRSRWRDCLTATELAGWPGAARERGLRCYNVRLIGLMRFKCCVNCNTWMKERSTCSKPQMSPAPSGEMRWLG